MWTTSDIYCMQHPKAGGVLQLVGGLPGKPDGETEYSIRESEVSFRMSTREDYQGHYPHTLYYKSTPKPRNTADNTDDVVTLYDRIMRYCHYKNGIQVNYIYDRETLWGTV